MGEDVTAEHNISGTYAYSPISETTISATYKPKQYVVNYTIEGGVLVAVCDEENKRISSGDKIGYGESLTINMQPVEGESLLSYRVNGEDKSSEIENGLHTIKVTADTNIEIKYTNFSGLDDATATLAEVYTSSNKIVVVTPKQENVTIYNMSGMIEESRVVNGRDEITKASGLYIVKVGSLVYKVKL